MIKVITRTETAHTTLLEITLIPLCSDTCWSDSEYKVRQGRNAN